VLGLPFCFTEVDVSSANEHMRADDLEEGLREAQAHPAVYVVVLWGFCDNAHLVNQAGRRAARRTRTVSSDLSTTSKREKCIKVYEFPSSSYNKMHRPLFYLGLPIS
jgi:hypothetical protein